MDEGSRPPAEEDAAGETDENGHEDDSEEGGLLVYVIAGKYRAKRIASRGRCVGAWAGDGGLAQPADIGAALPRRVGLRVVVGHDEGVVIPGRGGRVR